jgi:hypothetical protein
MPNMMNEVQRSSFRYVFSLTPNSREADLRSVPAGKKPPVKTRRSHVTALLPFVSVVLLLPLAETTLRLYHFLRWDISMIDSEPKQIGGPPPISVDPDLGWRPRENYRFDGKKRSSDGTNYAVTITQDAAGFRMFGDLTSGKPRVLVIGDSDTHAIEASDNKTYYAILKQLLDVEVFAYGARGYGSLQELMILDKYYDLIQPDLVVWQYSIDDFIDNSPDLKPASTLEHRGMFRPYWMDGKIVHISSKSDRQKLRLLCRFCHAVTNRLDKLAGDRRQTAETEASQDKSAHSAFLKSVEITDAITEMAANRAHPAPVFAFVTGTADSSHGPQYEEALAAICRRHNITFLDQIENAVVTAEKNGAAVRAADQQHWNELGHSIAGEALANSLREILSNTARIFEARGSRRLS